MLRFEIGVHSIAPFLKVLVGTVENSQVMQILAHIHLAIRNGHLIMTTSNTEMEVSVDVPITIDPSIHAAFTVSARKLSEIIRLVSSEDRMEWSCDGQWVYIVVGKARYRLATFDVGRFPFLLAPSGGSSLSVSAGVLRRLLDQVVFCCAKQDIRIYLNGVLFDATPGSLSMVASDGYRMALRTADLQTVQHDVFQAVIPRRTAFELSRLLSLAAPDQEVGLSFVNHIMTLSYGPWVLRSHLIDAQYPPYRRILNKTMHSQVVLPVAPLRLALSRMAVCSSDRFRGIRIQFESGRMILQSENFDQEEAIEEIEIIYEGPSLRMSVGLAYLHEIVTAIDSEHLLMKMNADEVFLIPENDPTSVYMIVLYEL